MSLPSSASRDRHVGLDPLLVVDGREALHQLAGDADDDLLRPEAGHLLGLLERDGAVVDDGRDVGDGARLHVREALALAPDAADDALAVLDLEDERLRELRADVERGARRQPVRVACPGSRAGAARSSATASQARPIPAVEPEPDPARNNVDATRSVTPPAIDSGWRSLPRKKP